MKSDTAPTVTPSVVFIDELLDQIADGKLLVPKFQRPYEWTARQMTFLFDSIRMGYPIGSLLFWETGSDITPLERIGGQAVQKSDAPNTKFVLDGHQRLSTLFGVLRRPKDQESDWKWEIAYDLRTKSFVHTRTYSDATSLLPMDSILRTMDFIRECRRIDIEVSKHESMEFIEEAERVAQRFKGYKLPINVITGGLDQAVETFSRLNTTGRAISVDQMVSALTYQEGEFHLETRIDEILESLSDTQFGQINRTMVFRTIVAAMEFDVYKTDWRRVSAKEFPNLPKLVDSCEKALLESAMFLQEIKVPSARVLPYEPIMMVFAEFFRKCGTATQVQRDSLKEWFWKSSYTGWFTGASDSNINRCLEVIREYSKLQNDELKFPYRTNVAVPFPENFNSRSARVRTLLLFLLSLRPRSLETGEILEQNEIIRRDGLLGIANVVTGLKSVPGNKLIVGDDHPRGVADRLRQIEDKNILDSHAICDDAIQALRSGRNSDFVRIRNENLKDLESEFIAANGLTTQEVVSNQIFDEFDD